MNLPDINVWVSLARNGHPHHAAAVRWISSIQRSERIYFCRISQLGLLRMLSRQVAANVEPLSQRECWRVFDEFLEDPRIAFAVEPAGLDLLFRERSRRNQVVPKLWTDDYLSAFAEAMDYTLVTFDKAFAARTPGALLLA